jgi:hypothetical protein
MPGFVDPRPAQQAHLRELRDELDASTDEQERSRLEKSITELEREMGHGHGLLRLFVGWRHRSVPW